MKKWILVGLILSVVVVAGVVGYLSWGSTKPKNQTNDALCQPALSLQGLPSPTAPWFTARVNYSGNWRASITVFTEGRMSGAVTTECFTGRGQGFFLYQTAGLSKTSTAQVIATKLDGASTTLDVAVNGFTNSTALPYGNATVLATADSLLRLPPSSPSLSIERS